MWAEASSEETQPKNNGLLVVNTYLSLKLKTGKLFQGSVLEKGT